MIRSIRTRSLIAVVLLAPACSTANRERAILQTPPASTEEAALPLVREPDPVAAGRAETRPGPYNGGTDVLHYDIELALRAESPEIVARATLDLLPTGREAELDLTGLAVSEVRVDGERVRFGYRNGKLVLPVPGRAAPVRVEVRYRGTPDDGLIHGETVHGTPSVFADNWPNRARFWFPSVDHPSDKATVRFRVHAPDAWQVIANGELEGTPTETRPETLAALGMATPPSDMVTWTWSTEVEIPAYTMVVGATEFVRRTLGRAACGNAPATDGCADVGYWVFRPDSAHAEQVFGRAPEMVDYFTELIGPFPYEKLENVQSSTRFGGMENASAIFYSEQALASGRDIEGTVSHEIAHQWFGDSVTERDWSHLWLSEGFATYFGALFFEHADGLERFREMMARNRERYLTSGAAANAILSESDDLFQLLNANNYQKGGWVLHMLRGVVGDSAFFAGIRTYYDNYKGGTALTTDLQGAMELATGLELGWFFEQWLEQPGHPVLETEWAWDGRGVDVEIRQVQSEDWPAFRMPATLEVRTAAGTLREQLIIEGRITRFRMASPREPTAVTVDPDDWILKETR